MQHLLHRKAEDVPVFATVLLKTGPEKILHNVHTDYWGKGKDQKGKTFFGILIIRAL